MTQTYPSPTVSDLIIQGTASGGAVTSDLTNATTISNSITNTMANWTGYLSGTINPNPMSMSGTITFGGGANASLVIVPLPTRIFSAATSQLTASLSTTASGGTGVMSLQQNNLVIAGAPTASWWTGFDTLTYSGTGGNGQHVARYAQTNRTSFTGGGSINNPPLWGAVSECNDLTGQKSSASNLAVGHGINLSGHNIDDASNRILFQGTITSASHDSNFYEVGTGYGLTVVNGSYVKMMANFTGAFTTAAIDLRNCSSYGLNTSSNNSPVFPTLTDNVVAGRSLPVSNVMPFTSDIYGRDINNGYSNSIYFPDGTNATVSAYTITGTGATPAGVLTVSAAVTESSGTILGNNSKAIWLGTGYKIALDTLGITSISSDGISINVIGNFATTGSILVGAVLRFGSNPSAAINSNTGTNVMQFGLPLRMPAFTVATLPITSSSNHGSVAWAYNARSGTQAVGAGTGCVVYTDFAGRWLVVGTGLVPVA